MFGRKRHLFLARKRLSEMDKALAALERMTKKAPAKVDGRKLLSELKRRRAQLAATADQMKGHIGAAEARMKKLSVAGSLSWSAFRVALTKSQRAFARANHKSAKAIRRAVR